MLYLCDYRSRRRKSLSPAHLAFLAEAVFGTVLVHGSIKYDSALGSEVILVFVEWDRVHLVPLTHLLFRAQMTFICAIPSRVLFIVVSISDSYCSAVTHDRSGLERGRDLLIAHLPDSWPCPRSSSHWPTWRGPLLGWNRLPCNSKIIVLVKWTSSWYKSTSKLSISLWLFNCIIPFWGFLWQFQ